MNDLDSIDSLFTQAMGIVNQIRSYGETLGDQQVIEKMLRSLPNKFDSRVAAIEESKNLSFLSIDELMGSLLSHEQRLNHFHHWRMLSRHKFHLEDQEEELIIAKVEDILHQEE